MHGIEAVDDGTRVTVGMRGEFDAHSLPDLREALAHACASGKPVVVDLSGVTFLDLRSACELVLRSLIQASQIAFENPSPATLASIRALGMDGDSRARTGQEDPPVFRGLRQSLNTTQKPKTPTAKLLYPDRGTNRPNRS